MSKQVVVNLLKYTLGFSLLAWMVWRYWTVPPPGIGVKEALQNPIHVTPLFIAAAFCLCSLSLTFLRWYLLVRAQDLPFTIINAFRLGLMGYSLSTLLPGAVGGDVFKAYRIAREQRRRTVAVATVLIDRAIGLWGLAWLVVLVGGGFWLYGDPSVTEQPILQVAIAMTAVFVLGTVMLWLLLGVLPQWRADRFAGRLKKIPKIGSKVSEFWRAVWMYRCQARTIALALGMTIVGHVGFTLTFFFGAQVLTQPGPPRPIPTLPQHFVIVPIGMTWQALFPTPGGIGGGEVGFGTLYRLIDYPETNGGLAGIMYRIINWSIAIVGYILYLRIKPTLTASEAMAADSAMEPEPGRAVMT